MLVMSSVERLMIVVTTLMKYVHVRNNEYSNVRFFFHISLDGVLHLSQSLCPHQHLLQKPLLVHQVKRIRRVDYMAGVCQFIRVLCYPQVFPPMSHQQSLLLQKLQVIYLTVL